MSHEIRTPLNAIVGFSSLLAEEGLSGHEREEYYSLIDRNSKLLLTLIDDILDLSKIEAGTLEFNYSGLELRGLLSEIVQVHRLRSHPEAVVIELEEGLEPLSILSDRHRLMQVVTNFVTNAVKFTEHGSIRIGYRLEEPQGMVRIYVSDTGCGIDPSKADSIFGRFVKLDSFKQGTGLGLSICRSIVERLGGRIGVQSAPGEGSTFWFTVPSVPPPQSKQAAPCRGGAEGNACRRQDSPRAGKRKKLVLVAEDNASNYRLFESLLKGEWELAHAWDGEQAVGMYRTLGPDVILMDIKMPRMDGYEAFSHIRAESGVPIVAVTAYAFEQDEARILSAGFDAYISKPIDPQMLRDTLRRLTTPPND